MTDDRTASALERIATALEQMALDRGALVVEHVMGNLTGEPPLPTPPPDFGEQVISQGGLPRDLQARVDAATVALPPVQPFQFTGPTASCPVHRVPWKTVPAGTSKKTGKPYGAFLVCSVQGCEERPRA